MVEEYERLTGFMLKDYYDFTNINDFCKLVQKRHRMFRVDPKGFVTALKYDPSKEFDEDAKQAAQAQPAKNVQSSGRKAKEAAVIYLSD